MRASPGARFQLWPQMIFVCAIFWLMSSYLLIPRVWECGSPTLGSFNLHIDFIARTSWQEYWHLIEQRKLQNQVYLRGLLPAITLLIFSIYATRKLLWIVGGRDSARHIAGPVLLDGKKAVKHANARHKSEA